MNRFLKQAVGTLFAAVLLLTSCTNVPPAPTETEIPEETEKNTETSVPLPSTPVFPIPEGTEKRPTGEIDPDADTLSTIVIRTADDLMKIGTDKDYPLSGDYTLVADLDLSHIENFTPIGGAKSDSGIVSGDAVFSGTFDGRGHTIVGLNISVSTTDRVHVGLFGSVGSKMRTDPAAIRNLILKDVSVTGPALGPAAYGVLMGQASGFVTVDNIAILSGTVEVGVDEGGDLLGAGALIGQCRTELLRNYANTGIHITNIFTNVTVIGNNNGRSNYTSGLIGRIRGSNLGTLSNILQMGSATHEGELSHAISTGDSNAETRENVFYAAGCGTDANQLGVEKSLVALNNASVPLTDEKWHIERGLPPLLAICYESPLFSSLDFLTLTFMPGETTRSVTSDFILPDTVLDQPVQWLSSDESVLSVNGRQATVTPPALGTTEVTLTAYTESEVRDFVLTVWSDAEVAIVPDLTNNILYAKNYPAGTTFTWIVEEMATNADVDTITETEGKLVLTDAMDNCRITLKVPLYDPLVYYHSSLPTFSINSSASIGSLTKTIYVGGELTIYTVKGQEKTEYDGDLMLKGRGNTTLYRPKKPLRLKLDKKTDLFGMGKSKNWVLLANYNDRANLRNKLSYDFGMSLGLAGCESRFVNLIYNGMYEGLYLLCEPVHVGEDCVDIFDWEEKAKEIAGIIAVAEGLSQGEKDTLVNAMTQNLSWVTTGKARKYTISDYYDMSQLNITGGYLIENDEYYDEASKFTTDHGMLMMAQSPEYLSTNEEMTSYIRGYIQNMEDALFAPNRLSGEGKHYTEYMDTQSLLDFFMVNQFFKNVEVFYKSSFMYKDVDGLLTFGPIWDMDWTAGNHTVLKAMGADPESWQHEESPDREVWFRAVYNDPWFMVLLCERWREIQGNIDEMLTEADALWAEIKDEALLNDTRWKHSSYSIKQEFNMLKTWLINRRTWMNTQMASPDTLLTSLGYYIPSVRLSIASYTETEDGLALTLSVADDTLVSCDVLVNGRVIREEAVTDGGVILIDKALLREAGKYNAIELLGKKADGKYNIILPRRGYMGSDMADSACLFYMGK